MYIFPKLNVNVHEYVYVCPLWVTNASRLISIIAPMPVIPASLSGSVSFFDGGCRSRAGTCGYGHPYRQPWLWPSESDRGQEPQDVAALPPGLLSPTLARSPLFQTPSRPLLINPDPVCSRKAAGSRPGNCADRLPGRVAMEGGGMVRVWSFGLQGQTYHWLEALIRRWHNHRSLKTAKGPVERWGPCESCLKCPRIEVLAGWEVSNCFILMKILNNLAN